MSGALLFDLLRTWQFFNMEEETSAENRCVSVVATDNGGLFGTANVTVAVELVNDETPLVALPYDSIDFAEDSLLLRLFTPPAMVSILDSDDNSDFLMEEATITLSGHAALNEWLMFDFASTGVGSVISGNFDRNTGVLTLRGPATVQQFEMVSHFVLTT